MDLIGRAAELEALEAVMLRRAARLVTLTGPPGIGKTRMAQAIGRRTSAAHPDGVMFVDLAALADARLVLTAIASALGIRDTGERPVSEALAAALSTRRVLLILDNFEHVLAAASDVRLLVDASPHLQVLITSRSALHVPDECEFALGPLQFADARALFIERAQAARAGFRVSDANERAVSTICVQLEGVPLAIELAAARVQVLSAEQIAERLADCLRLLTNTRDAESARHRSLRVALDWSVRQLAEAERMLLRRLAVFAGGASLGAIEHACGTTIADGLRRLADQSLLIVTHDGDEPRYRLLEPVRQYALEQLRAAGEEALARERLAAWCLDLAERARQETMGRDQILWLDQLEREYGNLRAAVSWYVEHRHALEAVRLTVALWKFCEVRGHAGEGEGWLNAALALGPTAPVTRGQALVGAANLAFVRGDYARAGALHAENLGLQRGLGDRRGIAISLLHLANVKRSCGDSAGSVDVCRESLALFRQIDDVRMCANVLNSLGMALLDLRAFAAARQALEEALALNRRLGGSRRIAIVLGNLGDLACAEADYDRADTYLQQSLALFSQLEDAWGSSATLESLALVACARGHAERSATLFGAAEAQREEAGAALAPADLPAHQRALATIQLRLGAAAAAAALEYGRRLPRAEAQHFARTPGSTTGRAADAQLTEREREVAALIARGASNYEIAHELVISKRTADTHVGNILKRLGLGSRAQLAVWWVSRSTYL